MYYINLFYAKSLLSSINDEAAPNANAPTDPAASEIITVKRFDESVATLPAGYSIIPNKNVNVIVSHNLFLKKTLTHKNSGQNTPINKIFETKHMIRPGTFASNVFPAISPAATVPITYDIIIAAPPNIPAADFETT